MDHPKISNMLGMDSLGTEGNPKVLPAPSAIMNYWFNW